MTAPNDSSAAPAVHSAGRWQYPLLFALQSIGAVLFCGFIIPIYRRALAAPETHRARTDTLVWALCSLALMQSAYWISRRTHPPLPQFKNTLLGHFLMFLSRMSFVLAASVFCFVFITQKSGFHIPVSRYILCFALLFSLFCYTLELERLGKSFLDKEK